MKANSSLCAIVGLSISLAAFADEETLSPDAVQLTGAELQDAFSGGQLEGMYLDSGTWYHFTESFSPDGTVSGAGGPASNKDKWLWHGEWEVDGDTICLDYDEVPEYCSAIYRDNDLHKTVPDGGREVSAWYTIR